MKPERELSTLLRVLKEDERLYYSTATVFANAPLALVQLELSVKINLLEQILELPRSRFPLIKEKQS